MGLEPTTLYTLDRALYQLSYRGRSCTIAPSQFSTRDLSKNILITVIVITKCKCDIYTRSTMKYYPPPPPHTHAYTLTHTHTHSVPDYTEMQGASNYLVPVRSRSEDTYAEWRDILNHLLLEQSQLTFINSLGEGA